MWEQLVQYDQELFTFFNGLGIGRYTQFWLFVTQIYNWIPLYLVFFYLLYKYTTGKKGLTLIAIVIATAAATLFITNVVKDLVGRLRPNNEPVLLDSVIALQRPENFSFWSGHSAVSFAVTTLVILLLRYYKASLWYYLFYIWPVLFALSRLFVGVHYPADLITGALVGIGLGVTSYKLTLLLLSRLKYPGKS